MHYDIKYEDFAWEEWVKYWPAIQCLDFTSGTKQGLKYVIKQGLVHGRSTGQNNWYTVQNNWKSSNLALALHSHLALPGFFLVSKHLDLSPKLYNFGAFWSMSTYNPSTNKLPAQLPAIHNCDSRTSLSGNIIRHYLGLKFWEKRFFSKTILMCLCFCNFL